MDARGGEAIDGGETGGPVVEGDMRGANEGYVIDELPFTMGGGDDED